MPYLAEIENLVFQGGGVRGIAYLGALEHLTLQQNSNRIDLRKIKRVCGASAGAICAFLLALGYNIQQVRSILTTLDMKTFLDKDLDQGGISEGGFNKANTFTLLYEIFDDLVGKQEMLPAMDLGLLFFYEFAKGTGADWIKLKKDKTAETTDEQIAKLIGDLPYIKDIWSFIIATKTYQDIKHNIFNYIRDFAIDSLDQFLRFVIHYGTKTKLDDTTKILNTFFMSKPRPGAYSDFTDAVRELIYFFIQKKYLFSGNALHAWFHRKIQEIIPQHRNLTFSYLHLMAKANQWPDLYLVGVNLSTGYTQIFSHCHTPEVVVADAVRVSMSIPFFFAPFKMQGSDDLWTDGGVTDNYPVWIFDTVDAVNPRTLGLRLVNKKTKEIIETGDASLGGEKPKHDAGLPAYTLALAKTILGKQESDFFHSHNITRTILVDVLNVGTVEFGMSNASRDALIKSGGQACSEFLSYRQHYEAIRSTAYLGSDVYVAGIAIGTVAFLLCKKLLGENINHSGFLSGVISSAAVGHAFFPRRPLPYLALTGKTAKIICKKDKFLPRSIHMGITTSAVVSLTYLATRKDGPGNLDTTFSLKSCILGAGMLAFATTFLAGRMIMAREGKHVKTIQNSYSHLPTAWQGKLLPNYDT